MKGILPSTASKYRNKYILIAISTGCMVGFIVEIGFFNYYAFSDNVLEDDRPSHLIKVKNTTLMIAFIFNLVTHVLLGTTLWLLINSRATVEDPGQLNTKQLWILLVFYFLYTVTNGLRLIESSYDYYTIIIEVTHWFLVLLVMAADVYILVTFEISHF